MNAYDSTQLPKELTIPKTSEGNDQKSKEQEAGEKKPVDKVAQMLDFMKFEDEMDGDVPDTSQQKAANQNILKGMKKRSSEVIKSAGLNKQASQTKDDKDKQSNDDDDDEMNDQEQKDYEKKIESKGDKNDDNEERRLSMV